MFVADQRVSVCNVCVYICVDDHRVDCAVIEYVSTVQCKLVEGCVGRFGEDQQSTDDLLV